MHDLGELLVVRLPGAEPDLTAELVVSLEQGNAVPSTGRDLGHLQPGGTSAHHDHRPRRGRTDEQPLAVEELLTRRRVLHAADRLLLSHRV